MEEKDIPEETEETKLSLGINVAKKKKKANKSVGCIKKKVIYQFILSGSFTSILFNIAQASTLIIRYELINDALKQVFVLYHKIKCLNYQVLQKINKHINSFSCPNSTNPDDQWQIEKMLTTCDSNDTFMFLLSFMTILKFKSVFHNVLLKYDEKNQVDKQQRVKSNIH